MKSLSIQIIKNDNASEPRIYYDDFSLILGDILIKLGHPGTKIVSILDFTGEDTKDDIKKIIDLYKDEDNCIIVSSVEPRCNINSENLDNVTADELLETINNDRQMLQSLGFVSLDIDLLHSRNVFPYIYSSGTISTDVIEVVERINISVGDDNNE